MVEKEREKERYSLQLFWCLVREEKEITHLNILSLMYVCVCVCVRIWFLMHLGVL